MKAQLSKWFVAPAPSWNISQRRPIQCLGPWSGCRIERDRLTARDLEIQLQMVLVLSNARPMMPDGDAVGVAAHRLDRCRESFRSCGELIRATRQDDVPLRANGDFLAAPDVANANGSPSFKFHARGQSVDAHLQVLSAASPVPGMRPAVPHRRPRCTVMSIRPKPSC